MELESDPVPYETPLQSSLNSFQDSHEQFPNHDDQRADSAQLSLHLDDTHPESTEKGTYAGTDDSHHHSNKVLGEKDSLSESGDVFTSDSNPDTENSPESGITELNKNSNMDHQEYVSRTPSHHMSSDEAAPVNLDDSEGEGGSDEEVRSEDHSDSSSSDGHTDALEREEERDGDLQQDSKNEGGTDIILEKQRTSQDDGNVGDAEIERETGAISQASVTTENSHASEADLNPTEDIDKETEMEITRVINEEKIDSGEHEVSSETDGGHLELSKEGESVSVELSSEEVEGEEAISEGGELGGGGDGEGLGEVSKDEEGGDDDMMTFEEFKQKKMEEGMW